MSLFQHTILSKYIAANAEKISAAYQLFVAHFHNPKIQEIIRSCKEEEYKAEFLRDLFVKVFGYTLKPELNFNLIREKKNETNSKKADGAILVDGEVVGVIELKDTKTTDLKNIETQAFGYKNYNKKAVYVITSNFEKLRFYIDNAIDYEEFNLFTLSEEKFAVLWLCLAYENIAKNLAKHLKTESVGKEEQITRQLYKDYSAFKRALFDDIRENNKGLQPLVNPLALFKKTQKLLDRLLFILFAEDSGLLPPNSIMEIVKQWEQLKELDAYLPLYSRLKLYFGYMNTGRKGVKHDIFAYNGGLFAPDEVLDSIVISDEILLTHLKKVSNYDFSSEVDVNILGHIFEHSLSEIEEISSPLAPLQNGEGSPKGRGEVSKRKKDGVFYTPRYITAYIVENTIGKLCADKKAELEIVETEYFADKKRPTAIRKKLNDKLTDYREWLLALTICDPACGSGAFLNAALDFLMAEHRLIDEMTAKLTGSSIVFPNIENAILENNLYGVDINDESVEIAKLALWLRTAKPNRKLNALNNNIKCGNSLISPVSSITRGHAPLSEIDIEKAFDWHKEFPQVFKEKEKRAFHITTAIHDSRTSQRMIDYKVREMRANNKGACPLVNPQSMTEEDEIIITKTITEIVKEDNLNVLAYNICRDHLHILLVCEAEELDNMVGKIKSKTARACNIARGVTISQSHTQQGGMPPCQKERGETQVPFWTQKFGYKEITNDEQLYNTIEYIENNRTKHELPPLDLSEYNKGACPLVSSIDHAFRTEYKGGFDVVIGNPPYVVVKGGRWVSGFEYDTAAIEYVKDRYKTAEQQINTYVLFLELAKYLTKSNGIISQITPNTFFTNEFSSKLRLFLIKNCDLLEIKNTGLVFADATVETAITTYRNSNYCGKTRIIYNDNIQEADMNNISAMTEDSKYLINLSETEIKLLSKLNRFERLNKYAKVWRGLTTGNDKKYLSNEKVNENYKPIISGSEIQRYFKSKNKKYVNYILQELDRPREERIFLLEEKLISKFVGNRLAFCYDNEKNYVINTACSLELLDKNISIKFLLCLLNSELLDFYFQKIFSDSRSVFPIMKSGSIELLPVSIIPITEQQPFISLADKMLSLNSELQTKHQRFLNRLSDNFVGIKITGNIETFDELTFAQFLTELAKQKITLSLKQQDEWEEYFNEYKTECRNFVNQINATDKEIDTLVYWLYGLTEEEIETIEKENR